MFAEYHDITDIPQHFLSEVAHFFEVYKDLEGAHTNPIGWESAETARKQILYSMDLYRERNLARRPDRGRRPRFALEEAMLIGKVIGTVVATRKDEKLEGLKFLMLRQLDVQGNEKDGCVVAVDAMGAGVGEVVLYASGSSARQTVVTDKRPCDGGDHGYRGYLGAWRRDDLHQGLIDIDSRE